VLISGSLRANVREENSIDGFKMVFNLRGEWRSEFLVRQDRWAEQVKVLEHDGGNSHSPMLETYKRMLLAFSPIWSLRTSDYSRGRDRLCLDLKELKAVYAAWPYPRS
jgi:uncharacterized protein YfbU (UPF0304 family)